MKSFPGMNGEVKMKIPYSAPARIASTRDLELKEQDAQSP